MKKSNYQVFYKNNPSAKFPSELEAQIAIQVVLAEKPELKEPDFTIKRITKNNKRILIALDCKLHLIEKDKYLEILGKYTHKNPDDYQENHAKLMNDLYENSTLSNIKVEDFYNS